MRQPVGATIREAKQSDLQQVSTLWLEMVNYHQSLDERASGPASDGQEKFREWMAQTLSREEHVLLVAEVEDEVVGFIQSMLGSNPPPMAPRRIGFISDLAVGASHRRRGIGRQLAETITQWFAQRDANEVKLSAAICNQRAIAFWRALGFEPLSYGMGKQLK